MICKAFPLEALNEFSLTTSAIYSLWTVVGTARGGFRLFACFARLSIHRIRRVLTRLIPEESKKFSMCRRHFKHPRITRPHCARHWHAFAARVKSISESSLQRVTSLHGTWCADQRAELFKLIYSQKVARTKNLLLSAGPRRECAPMGKPWNLSFFPVKIYLHNWLRQMIVVTVIIGSLASLVRCVVRLCKVQVVGRFTRTHRN